jgi:hypothetical protein
MQIKNRIQMLEKAIVDAGVTTNLDIGLPESLAEEQDVEPTKIRSLSTPSCETNLFLGLETWVSSP